VQYLFGGGLSKNMKRSISVFSLAAFCVVSGLANTFSFSNPAPAGGDGSVNASADISISGNMVTIVLHNLETDIGAPGQMISGFGFVVKNGVGTTLNESAVNSETGVQRTLSTTQDSNGDFGIVSDIPISIDWSVQNNNGDCLGKLMGIGLCALIGKQPDLMIIGPPAADGDYAVNAGVFNFQPYLAPDATTFKLTLACGGTNQPSCNGAAVTAANFAFGTGPDITGTATGNQVTPEPRYSAIVLMLIGGLVAFRFKPVGA
jgi:hypothetical protein